MGIDPDEFTSPPLSSLSLVCLLPLVVSLTLSMSIGSDALVTFWGYASFLGVKILATGAADDVMVLQCAQKIGSL